jgi:hypothetical protein
LALNPGRGVFQIAPERTMPPVVWPENVPRSKKSALMPAIAPLRVIMLRTGRYGPFVTR